MSKPDDMLSEQKHLHQCLNQCGYKNSIIDHAISFNKRHDTKTATSMQKNKCYVTLPYYGELYDKKKQILQGYDISTQFTLVHPNDKEQKSCQSCQSNVVYANIGEKSQPLQHCVKQLCRSSYNGND